MGPGRPAETDAVEGGVPIVPRRCPRALAGLALFLALAFAAPAFAASLTVNTLSDEDAADGACSLREAIIAANTNANYNECSGTGTYGDDTITFSVSGTIKLEDTLPFISDAAGLTIDGSNQITVSGQNMVQLLDVTSGASLRLESMTVANGLKTRGGGISNFGTLTVRNSTFSGNRALGDGGGIFNFAGTLTVTNSTFSRNSAGFSGGGIYNFAGTLTVRNSTFSENSAAPFLGGAVFSKEGVLNLANTILARSARGGDCVNDEGEVNPSGVNLVEHDDGCDPDALSDDPNLGPLADNGGPTRTHALFPRSPAIDAVPLDICRPSCDDCPPPETDQRGVIRPVDGDDDGEALCDIGAYERDDLVAPEITAPGNRTTEATGPGGAVVTYEAASAVDDVDDEVPVDCAPSPGSTFAIGATSVTCVARDKAGNEATASFTITVVDTTPPILTLPDDIDVETANTGGINIMYAASAEDIVDGPVLVTCSPASGGVFPSGETVVECSATDNAGNQADGSFKVTVIDPLALLDRLEAQIRSLGLNKPTENSLLTKVNSARKSLANGLTAAACSQLAGFVGQVAGFESAGKLNPHDVRDLIRTASRIRDLLGC